MAAFGMGQGIASLASVTKCASNPGTRLALALRWAAPLQLLLMTLFEGSVAWVVAAGAASAAGRVLLFGWLKRKLPLSQATSASAVVESAGDLGQAAGGSLGAVLDGLTLVPALAALVVVDGLSLLTSTLRLPKRSAERACDEPRASVPTHYTVRDRDERRAPTRGEPT